MAKKRFTTAWGWRQNRSIRRMRRLGNGGQVVGGFVTGASLGVALFGGPPVGAAGILTGLLAERIGTDYVNQANARALQVRAIENLAARGRASGRLAIAQGAAKRSDHVLRAARAMNRSTKRNGGGDGLVKGYYRQGPAGQVFVHDYNRRPPSR